LALVDELLIAAAVFLPAGMRSMLNARPGRPALLTTKPTHALTPLPMALTQFAAELDKQAAELEAALKAEGLLDR
jgi:hypothetical protein